MGFIDAGVKQIISLLLPAIFSVSWLYYVDRLVEFPLGILSIALATVILPDLSKSHAAGGHLRIFKFTELRLAADGFGRTSRYHWISDDG